jgi:hypothetical protein
MHICNYVESVCNLSDDSRTESLVHSITVVLHVVELHSNINIYFSVVHHMRILGENLSVARTQLLGFHLIGMRIISSFLMSEIL